MRLDQIDTIHADATGSRAHAKMISVTEAALGQELEAIADELYALKPDEFAAARDGRVKQLRGEGKPALARQVAKLRKPTLSAWLVNLLWRDQRDVMEQLFDLAAELSLAQAEASGPALRELTAQRRHIENALLRRAEALAQQAGISVTDAVAREAQETLSAALAEPSVADEVRTGRLLQSASYSGFGVLPGAVPASRRPAAQPVGEAREPTDLQAAQRAREERERRERAERRVAEARARLEAVASELTDRTAAAKSAARKHAELQQQVRDLRQRLETVEREAEASMADVEAANRARERAEAERDRAREAFEEAQSELKR